MPNVDLPIAKTCGTCVYPVYAPNINGCLSPRAKVGKFVSRDTPCHSGDYTPKVVSALTKAVNVQKLRDALNVREDSD